MPAPLCCPIHREPLTLHGNELRGQQHGEVYPIVDGIPILIGDPQERRRLAAQAASNAGNASADGPAAAAAAPGASAVDFYNDPVLQQSYGHHESDLPTLRQQLEQCLARSTATGPVLEIGSGRGVVQGVGGADYVALDYSITFLRQHIRPEYQRVCGNAEQLPFPDSTFRCIFSIAALEHVPHAGHAFDEVHRLLRPGGVAYLWPAWHCAQYNCDGIPVRPYRDLTLRQKWVKATLPLRTSAAIKGLTALPLRVARRARWGLRKRPTRMNFQRLNAEYRVYWTADSDACSRLDSHEACLYFHSRGYELISPGPTARSQLLARHCPVVARKPTAP